MSGPVRLGDRGPPFSFGPLTRTDIVRYAGASGDMNPIHHDETFARSAGLPTVMAHGMLSAGLLGSFVTRWFGAGAVRRFEVRFRERVWPGDVLTARGTVIALSEAAGENRADLQIELLGSDGRVVVSGTATVRT
jgi:acyl dehydratase